MNERKNVQQLPPTPAASAEAPALLYFKLAGRPGTGSLPSIIAPPDHPRRNCVLYKL